LVDQARADQKQDAEADEDLDRPRELYLIRERRAVA